MVAPNFIEFLEVRNVIDKLDIFDGIFSCYCS